jgi:hypothetical protein
MKIEKIVAQDVDADAAAAPRSAQHGEAYNNNPCPRSWRWRQGEAWRSVKHTVKPPSAKVMNVAWTKALRAGEEGSVRSSPLAEQTQKQNENATGRDLRSTQCSALQLSCEGSWSSCVSHRHSNTGSSRRVTV